MFRQLKLRKMAVLSPKMVENSQINQMSLYGQRDLSLKSLQQKLKASIFRSKDISELTVRCRVPQLKMSLQEGTVQQYGPNFPGKAGVFAVRAGPIIANNISAAVKSNYPEFSQEAKLMQYIPQKQFLSLMMTGDGKAIGTKFGIAFSGRWVWQMKDWIDTGFMKLFYSHCLFVDFANQGTKQPNHDNLTLFQGEQDSKEQEKKKIAESKDRVMHYSVEQAVDSLKQDEQKLEFFEQFYIVDRMAKEQDFRKQVYQRMNS